MQWKLRVHQAARSLIIVALISLVAVAFGQLMLVTEVHTVEGSIEIIDTDPGFMDNSQRLTVAARTSLSFPSGEVVDRQVQITSYERSNNEFDVRTELRISLQDARFLVENIAALEALQEELRSFDGKSEGNQASARFAIEIVSSNRRDYVGTVETFVVRSDFVSLPFMFRGSIVISDRLDERRRVLEELAELVEAAIEYIDTEY